MDCSVFDHPVLISGPDALALGIGSEQLEELPVRGHYWAVLDRKNRSEGVALYRTDEVMRLIA